MRVSSTTAARALCLALALCAPLRAQEQSDLTTGIHQVDEGDFEGALLTLDRATQQLALEPGRSSPLAQAYLYLGVAYVGLGQEALARAKFRQALRHDPGLRPQPGQFAAKVLRTFEAARQARTEAVTLEKQAGRKSGTGGLILLGVGGAAAAGVAASVVTKERENRAPTASVSVTPEGQAIQSVTRLSFSASASDPEGEPLSYGWDFGDGQGAFGPSVTHLYYQRGTFSATLSVRDGLTSTSVPTPVTVGVLQGRWTVSGLEALGVQELELNHSGDYPSFGGSLISVGGMTEFFGTIEHPRVITANFLVANCNIIVPGEAGGDLRTITGQGQCRAQDPGQACRCHGQRLGVRMTRQ